MKKTHGWLFALLLTLSAGAGGWEKRNTVSEIPANGCYLSRLNDLEESLADDWPPNSVARELNRYKSNVLAYLQSQEMSWEAKYYRDAFQAWFDDDVLEARNSWLKVLAWRENNPALAKESCLEAESLVYYHLATDLLDTKSQLPPAKPIPTAEKPEVESEPLVKATVMPVLHKAAASPISLPPGSPKASANSLPPGSIEDWIGNAEQAYRQGHLERALTLYGIAAKFNGEREDIRNRMNAIRKELD